MMEGRKPEYPVKTHSDELQKGCALTEGHDHLYTEVLLSSLQTWLWVKGGWL